MIKPLHLDGITYTPEQIRSIMQPLMAVRDCLLDEHLEYAAALSCIRALLEYLAENTETN